MSSSLADADAVAEVIHRLQSSVAALAGFGDGVGGVSVSGKPDEGPWPHIAVGPSGAGDLRDLNGGSMEQGVLIEFVGPLDMSVGNYELWQRAVRVLEDVAAMPDAEHPAGRAVMARVAPGGFITEQPLTSGQHKVAQTLLIVMAPPQG